ncbi:MAG: N-6 DNA methylase, partial [Bacteroidales bacterium]|nr:N-6 DNA methylase [Bacteroidales bacterium]
MTIFQKSVIKTHLVNLDQEQVEKAYQKFKENYSPAKIEKIKKLKEEEYQDGFLRDLFVDVFGYTLKPDDNYNLAREFKNQADGRKADGAILKNEKAIAVIELKSIKTKDLKSITEQAFNYKNNQPDCKYVITSNFQKLRFYIDYANEFEEFDLFHLQKENFELLYLILNTNSVFSDLPLKLKEETKFYEQDISDKLYKDYSNFKRKLFENLIKNNLTKGTCPLALDKLTLFQKSQKLLDRFLFILFAEDSGLLPPNSISRIVKRYEILKDEDAYKPLYDIFKQYFGYMNIGKKGKTDANNIPAYNGGLFYADELLDSLKIDDEILIKDLLNLSEYDFNTEVDVNILGHIFEHSLSEIEEITAELSAGTRGHVPLAHAPLTSKRKKDGIFYTPKYITQYIVENTIGILCEQKRKELEIEEIEFDETYRTKDGNLSVKGKKLYQKLKDYKDWLLSLKIVDPACGSGAFLNQALNFLIQEHKTIDDIIAELTNIAIRLFDTDIAILENNLYGVDINEESIEIAKLSLWLRTAQKGRKLSVLSNNIKCGNSLIDDHEVAGDKAFDWHKEFPQVFKTKQTEIIKKEIEEKPDYLNLIEKNAKLAQEKAEQSAKFSQGAIDYSKKVYEYAQKQKSLVGDSEISYGINKGGFDVVIGNPPYGVSFNKDQKKYLSQFDPLVPDYEIYIYFISLATDKLLKKDGRLSYIFPNTFLSILYGENYRQKIIDNFKLQEIVDLSNDNTFVDASVRTCILTLQNEQTTNFDVVFKKIESDNDKQIVELNKQNNHFLKQNIENWLNVSSYSKIENQIVEKIKQHK